MLRIRVLLVAVAIALGASPGVRAARPTLLYSGILKQDMAIVLATIEDVSETTFPRHRDPERPIPGFRFDLKIAESLRPRAWPPDLVAVRVPFSARGYATNWETNLEPENGMKVMAHLMPADDESWKLCPIPGGIVVLDEFDAPVVRAARRIVGIWELPTTADQLDAVLAGCHDTNVQYQRYCLNELMGAARSGYGIDFSEILRREEARTRLWEIYTAPGGIGIHAAASCDNFFRNLFRTTGWDAHPVRYDVAARSIQRVIERGESVQHARLGSAVRTCCQYPDHARRTFDLILEIAEKDHPYASSAVIHCAMLYEPHATDPAVRDLNRKIVEKLAELLSHENASIAEWAVIALERIAEAYAAVGPIPKHIMDRFAPETNAKLNPFARRRLKSTRDGLEGMGIPNLPAGATVLAYPWDGLVGKQVVVAARSDFRGGSFGAAVEYRGRKIWIELLERWPDGWRSSTPLLISGRLKKVADLPVFRYRPGQPFEEGLPVPEPYDLDQARERYVLTGATWTVRE